MSISLDQPVPHPREPPALDTGARIGRYVIIERVGSGAMGVVYGAYDPELDRKIALKLLKGSELAQEDGARARLLREAKAMARLAHPNVIAVHDVGIFNGQVFLAMEFLGGGTLNSWLGAGRRHWREVLDVFVGAGRGLSAAHAAGLVHRDFKPDNVLLDKDGRPRVVDFGLARDAASAAQDEGNPDAITAGELAASTTHLGTLTRTGTLMGTPAYMAPEQIAGDPIDERTDQFSFCVALYEALYGERPFRGDSLLRLLHNVSEGHLEPMPEDRELPAWIRRAVLRGLKADPAQRWPSMAALIAALLDDPAARDRRRFVAAACVALVIGSVVTVTQVVRQRQEAVDREVSRHLHDATLAAGAGRAKATELRELRRRSFAAFDALDRGRGEELWLQALVMTPAAEGAFQRAERAYETAIVLDPARASARRELTELLSEHILLAQELHRDEQARALTALLERHDDDRRKRAELQPHGSVVLRPDPSAAAAVVIVERYQDEPGSGRRLPQPVAPAPVAGVVTTLPPGSYRVVTRAPGYPDAIDTFELADRQHVDIQLRLRRAPAIPNDFVYVPAGDFWFGDADESLRTKFLDTVPIHRRHTDAFLIARHETTYRQWIEFLDALPPGERARHAPNVSAPLRGSLRLGVVDASWQLTFLPTTQRYTARAGEPFVYAGRSRRARQDWLDFPVAGTAPADAERYVRWLGDSGRVPGARLCSELEWERAARGADDRAYPHGDELAVDDANFDVTYGRIDAAFGPDVVGAHPLSRSPFGVEDMAGNLFELVRSSVVKDELVIRGGAYYFDSATCRLTNRNAVPSTFRDVTTGIRVCATPQEQP